MSYEYNKLMFTPDKNDFGLINYHKSNKNKVYPFIKYLPKDEIDQDSFNPTIYQDTHTSYNPFSKSLKLNQIPNIKNSEAYKTKSEYCTLESPNIIDCEITLEDNFSPINSENNYKLFQKSPTNYKNVNSINNNKKPLPIINEAQYHNRARSPKITRKNNYTLCDGYNNQNNIFFNNRNGNNDMMLKSNSVTKFNAKSQSSSPKKQNIIYNNNFLPLKDSSSTNNIHPVRTVQYQYKVTSNRIKKYNIIKKKQIVMSPNRNSNNLSINVRKKQLDNTQNICSYSTMVSRSPNYRKYNNNSLLLGSISPFYNNFSLNENENNLHYFDNNTNIDKFQYLNDNPISNKYSSVLNLPLNNFNNINSSFNKSQTNYLVNNEKNGIKINNNENYLTTAPKLYKPKFVRNNNANYKTISNNKEYNQKYLISYSPKKYNNYKNKKINSTKNSKENIYQYNLIKSFSPEKNRYPASNNINLKKNNFNSIPNSNSNSICNNNINQYISNIKSSLTKNKNYSNKNTVKEFYSKNINNITFGDDNSNFGNDIKEVKKFGKYSLHKNIPSENNLSLNNDYNINNSNKLKFNINEDDIHITSIGKSKNEDISIFNNNNNNFSKKRIINSKLSLNNKPADYFSLYMFEQINKLRENPQNFINNLKNAINNIAYDKKGNLYYNGNLKVALCKGKIAFEEAISFLENAKPMKPLIYKKELCVGISKNEKLFQSGDYLRKKINQIIMEGISVRAFWRDIIKDPEINFLLMVVDDNCIRRGAKRKDILNPEMKYIGINSGSMGKSFVCYTVLSDE